MGFSLYKACARSMPHFRRNAAAVGKRGVWLAQHPNRLILTHFGPSLLLRRTDRRVAPFAGGWRIVDSPHPSHFRSHLSPTFTIFHPAPTTPPLHPILPVAALFVKDCHSRFPPLNTTLDTPCEFLRSSQACRMLIGTCNPMLCPNWGFRCPTAFSAVCH